MKTSFWKTLWKYMKGYHKNVVIAILFSGITGIFVAIQPLILKYVIDQGIQNTTLMPEERMKTVAFFCGSYVLVYIGRLLTWAVGYRNTLLSMEGFLFNIRSEFFHHIQHLCMRFYETNSSGELFNYIMGTPMANLKSFLQQFALSVPYQTVSAVISLSAMLSYDWLLTLVMLVIIVISIVLNHYSKKKVHVMASDLLQKESEASKYIDDVLHGDHAIKMYAIEDDIFANFEDSLGKLKKSGVHLSFKQWIENAKPEFTQNVGTAAIYLVGAFSCIYRGMTVGELSAFIGSMSIVFSTMNTWFNINLVKANAEAGLDRIEAIMHVRTSTPEKTQGVRNIEVEKGKAQKKAMPCIEFLNVTFGYDERRIFEHFNCEMEYHNSYGLVGSSGSGKSTITKLIMRLYDPEEGVVRLHGRDVRDYSIHELRKSIGIVPQDPFMFQASIYENIRIACPEATTKEIMDAMEIARVHEFVNELPNGWNTVIGDGGYGISGGQKQRIAIARAILGKPDILIFDEATSALDNVSEKYIQGAIEELMKDHTVMIIAHRLTTIRNVDEIFVFDRGKIVQQGNFESLSTKEGLFQEMLGNTPKD